MWLHHRGLTTEPISWCDVNSQHLGSWCVCGLLVHSQTCLCPGLRMPHMTEYCPVLVIIMWPVPPPVTGTGERWIDYHWHPLDILPRQGPWLIPCSSASTSSPRLFPAGHTGPALTCLDNLMSPGSPLYSSGCSGKWFISLGLSFVIWTAVVRTASTNRIPGRVTWGQAHRKWKVSPSISLHCFGIPALIT